MEPYRRCRGEGVGGLPRYWLGRALGSVSWGRCRWATEVYLGGALPSVSYRGPSTAPWGTFRPRRRCRWSTEVPTDTEGAKNRQSPRTEVGDQKCRRATEVANPGGPSAMLLLYMRVEAKNGVVGHGCLEPRARSTEVPRCWLGASDAPP